MQQRTALSTVLIQIDLRRSSIIEENDRSELFCCRGRIEIKYLLSCLLQNNLLGVEMLFEIQKPRLSISNNISPPRRVILQQT